MTIDMAHNRLINTDPQITQHFKKPIVKEKKDPTPLPKGVLNLLTSSEPANPVFDFEEFDDNIELSCMIINEPPTEED